HTHTHTHTHSHTLSFLHHTLSLSVCVQACVCVCVCLCVCVTLSLSTDGVCGDEDGVCSGVCPEDMRCVAFGSSGPYTCQCPLQITQDVWVILWEYCIRYLLS